MGMAKVNILADALKAIMNASRMGDHQVLIRPISKVLLKFLLIMQKYKYIGSFQMIDDQKTGKIIINLTGKINKCGCISPRYNVTIKKLLKFKNTLLPSKSFGLIVITSSKGMMDHSIAIRNKISGKLLGFFY